MHCCIFVWKEKCTHTQTQTHTTAYIAYTLYVLDRTEQDIQTCLQSTLLNVKGSEVFIHD